MQQQHRVEQAAPNQNQQMHEVEANATKQPWLHLSSRAFQQRMADEHSKYARNYYHDNYHNINSFAQFFGFRKGSDSHATAGGSVNVPNTKSGNDKMTPDALRLQILEQQEGITPINFASYMHQYDEATGYWNKPWYKVSLVAVYVCSALIVLISFLTPSMFAERRKRRCSKKSAPCSQEVRGAFSSL